MVTSKTKNEQNGLNIMLQIENKNFHTQLINYTNMHAFLQCFKFYGLLFTVYFDRLIFKLYVTRLRW